jgi:hypothetical protein
VENLGTPLRKAQMSAAERQSITAALASDHRAITALLSDPAALAETEDGAAAREDIVMAIVRHFVAEEQFLDPATRRHLRDGDAIATAAYESDRACEQALRGLEDPDLTVAALAELLSGVHAQFVQHMHRQESEVFPALQSAAAAQELDELGDEVLGAELLAPTRPRRVASASPAVNKVLSFVEGFIDHTRDSYSKRGVREDTQD